MTLPEIASAEAAHEIAADIVRAMADGLARHGEDPLNAAIAAAAVVHALDRIGERWPAIPETVARMLLARDRKVFR